MHMGVFFLLRKLIVVDERTRFFRAMDARLSHVDIPITSPKFRTHFHANDRLGDNCVFCKNYH